MEEGLELKNKIKGLGQTIDSASKVLGISRQTLTSYTNQSKLKHEFKKLVFDKLGILIGQNAKEDTFELNRKNEIDTLREEVRQLRKIVDELTLQLFRSR